MSQGNFEAPNPDTGKAPKHQAAARKAFANSVSNTEVKPQSNGCADKVMDELDAWDPNRETIEELMDLINKLDECPDYDTNDPYEMDSRLSVADGFQEFADDYSSYPVWTVDYEGNALVGEDAGSFEHVNEINEDYFRMHDFTAEEVIEIQRDADAKMLDDEPHDEMRGKIYQFDDNSEWLIFQDSESAERQAVEYVKSQLDDEPEMFSQNWLQDYIYMTDTDRRMHANEESTFYSDELSDEDALKEAELDDKHDELQEEIDVLEAENEDLEFEKDEIPDDDEELDDKISDIDNKISEKTEGIEALEKEQGELPDQARTQIQEGRYDELYERLEDPVKYFVEDEGMYLIEELMESSFVSIDTEEASQAAVDEDGVANFLAGYDGNEVELDNGMIMYRTN